MNRILKKFYVAGILLLFFSSGGRPAGISVDAGLQPAEDKWIVRVQFRQMQREGDSGSMSRKMERTVYNTVLAYGLRRKVTIIAKQMLFHDAKTMAGVSAKESGLADLALVCKYGVYRLNTRKNTLGIAATIGLDLPSGSRTFSSDTWDLTPGLYLSFRRGVWAADFNITLRWNGIANNENSKVVPGNELSLDWALARQFSMSETGRLSVTPVCEISYSKSQPARKQNQNISNSGETLFFISPGFKLTRSSFIVEGLLKLPAWQKQNGNQLKLDYMGVAGLRYMF